MDDQLTCVWWLCPCSGLSPQAKPVPPPPQHQAARQAPAAKAQVPLLLPTAAADVTSKQVGLHCVCANLLLGVQHQSAYTVQHSVDDSQQPPPFVRGACPSMAA